MGDLEGRLGMRYVLASKRKTYAHRQFEVSSEKLRTVKSLNLVERRVSESELHQSTTCIISAEAMTE